VGADLDIRSRAGQVAHIPLIIRQDGMAQTPNPPRDPLLPFMTVVLVLWHLTLGADYLNARFALVATAPELTTALVLPQLWATVAWGLAVWLGLAGSLFLIFRDDAAVLLLFAAAVSALTSGAGDMMAGGVGDLLGLPRLAVLSALFIVPLIGWIYTRARHASGHLT
jgi:hypothetical protein